MKGKRIKLISLLFIATFVWQAECRAGWLRPRPAGERTGIAGKTLVENLEAFGIRVNMVENRIDFRKAPDNVDWIMDEIRPIEIRPIVVPKGRIKEIEERMPSVKLVHSLKEIEDLPPISMEGKNSKGVYIGLIEWQGEIRPAATKFFRVSYSELEYAQVRDRLGISPRFYGVVKNENGEIIGYAMQIAIGQAAFVPRLMTQHEELFRSEDRRNAFRRTEDVGLEPPAEYLITRKNKVIVIDAGDTEKQNSEKYEAFIRQLNEAKEVAPPAVHATPESEKAAITRISGQSVRFATGRPPEEGPVENRPIRQRFDSSIKGKKKTGVSKWDLLGQLREGLQALSENVIARLRQETALGERRKILIEAGLDVADAIDGKFLIPEIDRFLRQRPLPAPVAPIPKRPFLDRTHAGRHLKAYSADDFDFVVKKPNPPEQTDFVRRSWVGRGYKLAAERLGGLAVPTMIIDATDGSKKPFGYLLEKGGAQKADLAIIQKKVVPVFDRLKYLAKEKRISEAEDLIYDYKKFIIAMFRRGIMDFDFTYPYGNCGVDLETDKIYIFDFGDLDGNEGNIGMFLETIGITNKYFYDDLREHVDYEIAVYFGISPLQMDDFYDEAGESLFGVDLKPENMDSFKVTFPYTEEQIRNIFMGHDIGEVKGGEVSDESRGGLSGKRAAPRTGARFNMPSASSGSSSGEGKTTAKKAGKEIVSYATILQEQI